MLCKTLSKQQQQQQQQQQKLRPCITRSIIKSIQTRNIDHKKFAKTKSKFWYCKYKYHRNNH